MAGVASLEQLLARRQVRPARALVSAGPSVEPTGLAGLDSVLPGGGLPQRSLTELLIPAHGTGELELVVPMLARLTGQSIQVALVGPPHVPYAPAWQYRGVELTHLEIVQCSALEAAWAAEQCARAACVATVVVWLQTASDHVLRRLAGAAATGQCVVIAIRPKHAVHLPSPAAVRIALEAPGRARLLKCRGISPPATAIDVPAPAWAN